MVVAFFSNCRFFYYNDDVARIVMLMFFKLLAVLKVAQKVRLKFSLLVLFLPAIKS